MRKAPERRGNEITQSFNDGIVTIYRVVDTSKPGYKPVPGLQKQYVLRYEERRLGIQRYYSGMQNQVQIERVVRCPRNLEVSPQDVAVTEDGRQYAVHMVQAVTGVFPSSMDMTLNKLEQAYDME